MHLSDANSVNYLLGSTLKTQIYTAIQVAWGPSPCLRPLSAFRNPTQFVANENQLSLGAYSEAQVITDDGKVWGLVEVRDSSGAAVPGPELSSARKAGPVELVYSVQAKLSFAGLRQFLMQCVLDNPKNDETGAGLSAGRSEKLSNASTFDQLVTALR